MSVLRAAEVEQASAELGKFIDETAAHKVIDMKDVITAGVVDEVVLSGGGGPKEPAFTAFWWQCIAIATGKFLRL